MRLEKEKIENKFMIYKIKLTNKSKASIPATFVFKSCKTLILAISAARRTALRSAWLKYGGTVITAASTDCSLKSLAKSRAYSKSIAKISSGVNLVDL